MSVPMPTAMPICPTPDERDHVFRSRTPLTKTPSSKSNRKRALKKRGGSVSMAASKQGLAAATNLDQAGVIREHGWGMATAGTITCHACGAGCFISRVW